MKKLGFVVGLLLLLMGNDPSADHSVEFSWMGYCCGRADCIRAPVSIVRFEEVDVIVLVYDKVMVLPPGSVQESKDGHTYWCRYNILGVVTRENTRCVFYAIAG